MSPATTTTTTSTTFSDQKNLEKQIQKQMGCMTGFFQLLDRHHSLTGKRIPSPPPIEDSASESGQFEEPRPATPPRSKSNRSTPQLERSSTKTPPPSIYPFEIKEATITNRTCWKFREAPRLSLDSRATTDSNGTLHRKQSKAITPSRSPGNGTCSRDEIDKQRKSTSVIARLMGFDPLTTISAHSPQLRRSASESRVARDITHTLLDSANNYGARPANYCGRNVNQQQRIYYDLADVFPELKQSGVSVYKEIERRLSMSGEADASSKDLETLKHFLKAMPLKGLLHSNKSSIDQNFVYERVMETPIVVMKPSRSVESSPPSYSSRRNSPDGSLPSISPHRRMRASISPTRSESSVKSNSSSSLHRSGNSASERGRSYSVNSPKPSFRRSFDSPTTSSPRNRTSVVNVKARLKEKISLTLSDDSHNNNNNKGKTLLSRCDMLLQSIADMNSINSSDQPSPISVLDPCIYKEYESLSSSPSQVPNRSIDFKGTINRILNPDLSIEFEDEDSSWTSSAFSDDSEFLYVADVLRAIASIPEESDRFPLLEKQQYKKGEDGSNASKIKRKLIFDNVNEILHKNKQLPPWKADQKADKSSLVYVWSEFKKIREPDVPDQELVEVICGHLKKDLATNSFDFQIEVAESVLDMERLVFKDLIGEAIRDFASSVVLFYPRRKLEF